MKRLFFSFIIIIFSIYAKDEKDAITHVTTQGPTNVYIQVQNTNQQSQQVNNQPYFYNYLIKIKNFMLPQSLKDMKLEDLPAKLREELIATAVSVKASAYVYIKTHKYKIITLTSLTIYAIILSYLLYHVYHIMQSYGWGSWKESLPLDTLHALPKQELGKELLFEIQQKYQKAETLNDFFLPLVSFLHDVDQELDELKKFLFLYRLLQKMYLISLFPLQDTIVIKAHERVQRLLYLKEVFLYWVTDYKIAITGHARNYAMHTNKKKCREFLRYLKNYAT